MALNLKHQTAAQFAARLRERYRTATREECARLSKWILDRLDAGDVTDAQLRSVFGLTVNQWNTIKTKMIALRTAYETVISAQGE